LTPKGTKPIVTADRDAQALLNLAQTEIEIILTRQLASYLAMPIFIVDPAGSLLFYNEQAETLLGHRFEETGELTLDEWSALWQPTTEDGEKIRPEDLPLSQALTSGHPVHASLFIRGLDGVSRQIEVTGVPIHGQSGRKLGAFAVFWEMRD
jgi:PAS domain S-box-containing protein